MVFCQKCGAENKDDDRFCTSCGTKLVVEEKPEPKRQQVETKSRPKTEAAQKAKMASSPETPAQSGQDPRWLYSASLIIALALVVLTIIPHVTDLYLFGGQFLPGEFYGTRFWAEVAFAAFYGLVLALFLGKRTSKRSLVLPGTYLFAFAANIVLYPSIGGIANDAFCGLFVLIAILSALTR